MTQTPQYLEDRSHIYDLGVRYATALDSRDFDLLLTCFTDNATATYEGIGDIANPSQLARICRDALSPLAVSQHLLGNFACEIAPDSASAQWYFHAQHVKTGAEGGEQFIVAGTYRDQLIRTENGWRIRHRDLHVSWVSGNPLVLDHS